MAGRLIRALRPYSDDNTTVGEAIRSVATRLSIDRAGRAFDNRP